MSTEKELSAILEDIRLVFGTIQSDVIRLEHNISVVAGKLDEVVGKTSVE